MIEMNQMELTLLIQRYRVLIIRGCTLNALRNYKWLSTFDGAVLENDGTFNIFALVSDLK